MVNSSTKWYILVQSGTFYYKVVHSSEKTVDISNKWYILVQNGNLSAKW